MIVRNYLEKPTRGPSPHGGKGHSSSSHLFGSADFDTDLRFINYTELDPGASIGYHEHGENEEVYAVLEGRGRATVNGTAREVSAGDVVLNKPGWSHGLENTSSLPLRILVFEVAK
jgi:quercetin dioxygenase-like cupin family protein